MKGIQITKPGDSFTLVDSLAKPKPGPGQILVKSVATAINPVDTYMQSYGLLIMDWPIVLGCDAGGVVEEVGEGVKKFRVGDEVFGCTRLGQTGYSTFQEHYIMDEALTAKKPSNITVEQACTLGVGTYTASLGVGHGLNINLPSQKASSKDEWVVIMGGAGSVGQCAIQIAKVCGYKVLASCSQKTNQVALGAGADETLDYRQDEAAQLKRISEVTQGNFARIFDTVAQKPDLPFKALHEISTASEKYFTTTDDWTEMDTPSGIHVDRIKLGLIGRSGKDLDGFNDINDIIAGFVPKLETYIQNGDLKPLAYQVVGKPGLESVIDGIKTQTGGGSGGSKVVVRVSG